MNYTNRKSVFLLLAAFMLIITGCEVSGSNSNAPEPQQVSVKMQIKSNTASRLKAKTASNQAIASLTEVKLLVEELELENALDQDSLDFEVDDLVVNLPLDGSKLELAVTTIPEGVYDEFEMEIEGPDDGSSINDSDFYDDSDADGYSIVVRGVYNGEDFIYRTKRDFEFELDLTPPVEVSGNNSPSVAINVDPFSWFINDSGNALDPSDPANKQIIDENIAKSFGAELDDDQDQDQDHDNDDNGSDDGGSDDD